MDRLIALLAALVGLIALGGALLVHNSATAVMQRQATEIAALKESMKSAPTANFAPVQAMPAPIAKSDPKTAETVAALERRLSSLEQTTSTQAIELAAARAALDARADLSAAPVTEVAAAEPPPSSANPAAYAEDGPTSDCIPLGTRFMAQTGDSFPICKTTAVVNVSAVSDGSAIVEGAGAVAAGGFANLGVQGCTIMVFSADVSGFAEMRVSCV
ncbi:MAG: hypothetical protein ABIY37_04445 [Devosia sp.]